MQTNEIWLRIPQSTDKLLAFLVAVTIHMTTGCNKTRIILSPFGCLFNLYPHSPTPFKMHVESHLYTLLLSEIIALIRAAPDLVLVCLLQMKARHLHLIELASDMVGVRGYYTLSCDNLPPPRSHDHNIAQAISPRSACHFNSGSEGVSSHRPDNRLN